MTSDEARSIITKLIANLRGAGLEWVVQDVSTVVESGIEERKEVALETFDTLGVPIKKRGRKTEVTITRPFTDLEELRLLLGAIRAAVIDTHEIQEEALLGLKPEGVASPQISFRPDVPEGFQDKGYTLADGKRGPPFDLSLSEINRRRSNISRLRELIIQLEQKVHAD